MAAGAVRAGVLDRHGLDATRHAIIRVHGESMEPTLPDRCLLLFDRNRRDRREGRIYVVRTDGGLIVKRAAMRGRGRDLASDDPAGAALSRGRRTQRSSGKWSGSRGRWAGRGGGSAAGSWTSAEWALNPAESISGMSDRTSELASDNPAGESEPWPTKAETVGESVWAARTLVGPRRR